MQADFRRTTPTVFMVLVVLSATLAFGQGIVTGSISGTVLDPQGAAVPKASATATQTDTNRQLTGETNSSGQFQIRQVPPGKYSISVSAPGFTKVNVTNAEVVVGQDYSIGAVKMQLAGRTEVITVEGSAPLIETQTDQLQNTFTTRQTSDIPIGSTYDSLALFVPGVATAGSLGFSNNNGAELSVNGQRTRSNNFQIDGQSNNDNSVAGPTFFFGNQDAIAELQVITNYTAEYGRNTGSVINYVTKSGTNNFHGTLYEFNQSNAFDSLSNTEKSALFVDCGDHCPGPSKFVDNRFGGTIGGPIKKDKIWFFASANFERQRSAGGPTSSGMDVLTPTPAGVATLLSAFPGNPAVAALAAFGPTAVKAGNPTYSNLVTNTVTDGVTSAGVEFGSVTRTIPSIFNNYEVTGRVDFQLTQKDRFFTRYLFQQTINTNVAFDGDAAAAGGDFVDVPSRTSQIGLDWTHSFSNTLLNQARFSFNRSRVAFEGGAFPNCTQANFLSCPPQVQFASAGDLGFGVAGTGPFPQGRIINNWQVQDNASKVVGKHTLKFGGEYDKQRSPNVFLPAFAGVFTYDDFNSFLANTPSDTNIAFGDPKLTYREQDLAFYFQDDWRVKSNLTLNLGLRWEWYQQAINLLHDISVKRESGPGALWDPSLPLSQRTVNPVNEDKNNFGPVIGFAWTPRMWKGMFGEDKTVIRGGARIAYNPAFYNIFLNVTEQAPFALVQDFSSGLIPGLPTGTTTFTAAEIDAALRPLVPNGQDPRTFDQSFVPTNFHNPYSQQWNLGIQREITPKMSVEIRYVGNHTVGEFQTINGNPAIGAIAALGFGSVIPPGLTACSDPTAPGFAMGYLNCNKTNVQERANTAFSTYHGLQMQLKTANWHGLTLNASYTFSKTIDNASEIFSTASAGQTNAFPQNPFSPGQGERGISGLDYPHIFGLLWIYDVPWMKNQQGFLGHLLGGWQVNGTYRYTSPQAWTAVQTRPEFITGDPSVCDPTFTFGFGGVTRDPCHPFLGNPGAPFNNIGQCTNFALPDCGIVDFFTGLPTTLSAVHWIYNELNADKFFGTPFGNGRNTLRSPQAISTINLGTFKNIKMTERLTLQFQAVVFNLFNTQWRGAVTSARVTSSLFGNNFNNNNGGDTFAGNITTDGIGRRRMQFGLKLIF